MTASLHTLTPGSKYRHPPIQEAVFEIHYRVGHGTLESAFQGLQTCWERDYPKQRIVDDRSIKLSVGPNGVDSNAQSAGKRLVCRSTDVGKIVQVGKQFIAINQLPPYPGWEEGFRATITARAADVRKHAGDAEISRVGLRYINRIEIPQSPLEWEQWFRFKLPVPESCNGNTKRFQMYFEIAIPNDCLLKVGIVSVPPVNVKTTTLMLDLDIIWTGKPVAGSELPELMERVHAPHRLAFEDYLTEGLRGLFNEDKTSC